MHVSIITPVYNTPASVLARTWASLKNQTHTDWEWVIWDDSTNQLAWQQIWGFAADERYKLQAHKSLTQTGGNIGHIKRQLGMVANGDIIVELDHDDELMPTALEEIVKAFSNENVGFVFTDWSEINSENQSCRYPDGWAFGFGSDYWCQEHQVWAMSSPPINGTTVRHIVSMPNHARAWRSSFYKSINGHNPDLPVADDYELCLRSVLYTDWVHVPKMLYKQHIGPHTAQRQKNALIQELVQEICQRWEPEIESKFGLKP